jgi:membrane protein
MARRRTRPKGWRAQLRGFVSVWVECFSKNDLLTFASAIAFQMLVALVPLTLLAIGTLGALGERRVWRKELAPGIESRLPKPTFEAIDYAANLILHNASAGLLAFGVVLSIWEISGAVRAVMGALNRIYGVDENRPLWRRYGASLTLAVVIAACVIGALLALTIGAKAGGVAGAIARWPLAVILLSLAIWLILRLAPARPRPSRWVSLGSAFIVVAWLVASVIFRWYVTSVASFRSTWGSFVVVLVLTAYLYVSSIIFLVGVQLDELLRAGSQRSDASVLDRLRAAFAPAR